MSTRIMLGAACALWLASAAAAAQTSAPTPEARRAARASFERALGLADQRRWQEAIAELERAYALSPHFAVQYNLGKAYAALGKPVEAVAALERYLREGSTQIEPTRRAEVADLIAREQTRIATLTLEVVPDGAEVSVDGAAIGRAPLSEPLRLAATAHHVQIVLPEMPRAAATSSPERGFLSLHCELPDVELTLRGAPLGRTPLGAPVALPVGAHTLHLSRPGYLPEARPVTLRAAQQTELPCDLRPEPRPELAGSIEVAASESRAQVFVDGLPHARERRVPAGRHLVRVTRAGFVPWQQMVSVASEQRVALTPRLLPQEDYRLDYEARASAVRTWAIALGVGGVVLSGAAIGLLVWNDSRHDDWTREDDRLQKAVLDAEGGAPMLDADELRARQRDNNDLLDSIHTVDAIDLTTAAVGVLLGAAGVTLWLTGDDPDRYEGLALAVDPGAGLRLRAAY